MSHVKPKLFFSILLVLLIVVAIPAMGQASGSRTQGASTIRAEVGQQDSASRSKFSSVDDVAKRVDSLQFIVVYNAELLRRDLDSKVVWIYVMLGVMIVASMMMYGALNQAQRQRKELEEKVFTRLSTSVAELEAQIKNVEAGLGSPKSAQRSSPPRKKKSS